MNVFAYFQRLKLSFQLWIAVVCIPLSLVTFFIYIATRYTSALHYQAWILLTLLLIFFIAAHIVCSGLFIKKVIFRVIAVKNAMSALSSGMLTQPITADGSDELAEIITGMNNLNTRLAAVTEFTRQIGAGNLNSAYAPLHTDDLLGHSLLQTKASLLQIKAEEQKQIWTTEGLTKFVEILRSDKNVKELANDIIKNLVQLLHASQGAIFVLADEGKEENFLEMQACYAYSRTKFLTHKVAPGQGIIGQAFLEKETVYLKEIPEDFVRITSGLGDANPRHILITPLRMNEMIVGMVELASFREFEKHEIAFVEKLGENIAHAIHSFRVNERTKNLLQEAQVQAEYMRAQEEELRQNQEELQATQEEISRKYNDLFQQLSDLNYQSRFDQLNSITSTKKRNIEYYFDIIRNQIITFAENKQVIDAVKDFKNAFYTIDKNVPADTLASMQESLRQYYRNEFMPRLTDSSEHSITAEHYLPQEAKAAILQYLYISGNTYPTGQKSMLDKSADTCDYSQTHAVYHPVMRSFLEKFGYYDIFLIDSQTGDMLYSVFKEIDFATNLVNGLYHTTNFGHVVKEAIASEDKNFVKLVDFEFYDPSYRAPASFIACPVYDKEEKIGILVFQMPINKINQILTGDKKWQADGLGESGETFIVGNDYKLRSISRELIENEDDYLSVLEKMGYTDEVIEQIRKTDTSILLEEVKSESVIKALQQQSGAQIEKNSRGIEMLHAYAPLDILDVNWVIVSTMKEEEASKRINTLRNLN